MEIVQWFMAGESERAIAAAYGISGPRVHQILSTYLAKHPLDLPGEQRMAWQRLAGLIDRLEQLPTCPAVARELRQAIYTQARIAGYVAPERLHVQQIEPMFRPEDFEDDRFEEPGQPAPGRAPRFDLGKLEGFGNGEN
jgi:hypothetical protein